MGKTNVDTLKACKEFSERIGVWFGKGSRESHFALNQRINSPKLLVHVHTDVNLFLLKLIFFPFTLEALRSPSFANGYSTWAR